MSESLLRVQQQFQQFIVQGDGAIESAVHATKNTSVHTRLTIYQEAYYLRLIESLSVSFPALYAYLGCDEFNTMARAFIKNNPSHTRSIRWYGDKLSMFLFNYYDTKHAFLAELAHFEWHMTLTFDGGSAVSLKMSDVANIDPTLWASMRFKVHPTVQRVDYYWNCIELWHALMEDVPLPLLTKASCQSWIVWRDPESIIHYCSITPEQAWMFDNLQQGHSFATLCEGLCQWMDTDSVALTASMHLKNWVQQGMLVSVIF